MGRRDGVCRTASRHVRLVASWKMTEEKADKPKRPTIKIGSQRSEAELPRPKPKPQAEAETPSKPTEQVEPQATTPHDASAESANVKPHDVPSPTPHDASPDAANPGAENVTPTAEADPSGAESIRAEVISAEASEPSSSEADTSQVSGPQDEAAQVQVASGSDAPKIPSADELFPASLIDQMTGDLDDEISAALGDLSLDDLMTTDAAAPSNATSRVELDQRYPARVIKVDRESVFFSFAGSHEGLAPKRMFEEIPEVGAELEVIPTRFVNDDNLYELAVPGASMDVQDWSDLSEGVVVDATVTGHNKGGLEVEVKSIRGFIPVSHIALYRVDDMEQFVGQSLRCVVTEANEQRRNLVLSARAVLEREREAAKEKLLEELEVGQTREGTVTRLQDFGAFVDLGGIDGLIHVSQLSWDRIKHPSEVIEEGQKVKVRIEKLDASTGRIGLSYRDLLEDPWEDAETDYAVGTILTGRVTKLMEFGAFVRLAAGVEGLVHISEIAHHRVHRVNTVLSEGQEVNVKVLQCDRESQRISLSIKGAIEQPQETAGDAADEADEPPRELPKVNVPLKGGLNRPSGGDQFGLKW